MQLPTSAPRPPPPPAQGGTPPPLPSPLGSLPGPGRLLELPVHGQRNLRRDVDEPLAQEQAHRPRAVLEELVQPLDHALLAVLRTAAQSQRFDLLGTLGPLKAETAPLTTGHHFLQKPDREHHLLTGGAVLSQPSKSGVSVVTACVLLRGNHAWC